MRADAARATGARDRRRPVGVLLAPRGLLSAAAVIALAAGLSLIGGRATAELMRIHDTGVPGHLTLATDWRTTMFDIAPGEPGHWIIHARLSDVERGSLAVEIRSEGELSEIDPGVRVQLDRCDSGWAAPTAEAAPVCADGSVPVMPPTPLSAFRDPVDRMSLPDITTTRGEHLLLTASIDASQSDDARLMGRTGTIAVGLTAEGDGPAPAPDPGAPVVADPPTPGGPPAGGMLPRTGGAPDVVALLLTAVGALGLGLLSRRAGTRRGRAHAAAAVGAGAESHPEALTRPEGRE